MQELILHFAFKLSELENRKELGKRVKLLLAAKKFLREQSTVDSTSANSRKPSFRTGPREYDRLASQQLHNNFKGDGDIGTANI